MYGTTATYNNTTSSAMGSKGDWGETKEWKEDGGGREPERSGMGGGALRPSIQSLDACWFGLMEFQFDLENKGKTQQYALK